jgi:hypothetical protein
MEDCEQGVSGAAELGRWLFRLTLWVDTRIHADIAKTSTVIPAGVGGNPVSFYPMTQYSNVYMLATTYTAPLIETIYMGI